MKHLIGVLATSAMLLQSQIAWANCPSSKIAGAWNLAGTYMSGGTSAGFWCPTLTLTAAATVNKYNATGACKWMAAGLGTINYSASATGTLTVTPSTCKVTGSFVLTHDDSTETATVLSGRFENPTGTAVSAQGQIVALLGMDTATLVFTLVR